ncbi:3-hydroxylacyl-ACP dehydratase [Azospirillum sp. TSO35-2]|uniref:ApeP family dehydratase n=1 Tax=Azospirillum sp. TSO35-2 TaxID=716796 RepID=UPI000D612EC1|nr:3-hydroxylacyl-ACP dehydratase [Azospirillum sp. TSO35-2]PWC35984.1 hypothetical protein TSO352_12400 [Azospirillum sp. TSO35-2]
MTPCPWPIDDLLPHGRPMILIDAVDGYTADGLQASVTVRAGDPFIDRDRGAPAHLAIEWMAQACGAFVGVEARRAGAPVRLGLLLGTRNFAARQPWFPVGTRVGIRVALVYRDGEMGVFDCAVTVAKGSAAGDTVAEAQLTVYQPQDARSLLENDT